MMDRRNFLSGIPALGLLPFIAMPDAASAADIAPVPPDHSKWPADGDSNYWPWIRRQFSIPRDEAYFNSGTIGACPHQVLDAVIASMRDMEKTIAQYDYHGDHPEYIAGYRPQVELRKKAGAAMNATAEEIALVQNATVGINFIANGLDLKPGDEVLLTDQEHPGAQGPWELRAKRQGIVLKKLPIPVPTPDPQTVVKVFADAIGPNTKVIAVPHITSRYGIVLPVRELCDLGREHGLFTLIDGAQALGQLRVDVKQIGCDAYATSPHKWLLAPPGNGLLYVRAARDKDVWPTLASAHWDDYTAEDGIFRLMQFGTANAALLAGLDAALDFNMRIGAEKIERRIVGLADSLRAGLQKINGVKIMSPTHPALAAAMVTYSVEGVKGSVLQDELWKRKKYRVREQPGQAVRQSVHLYNSPEEISGTLEVIASLAGK